MSLRLRQLILLASTLSVAFGLIEAIEIALFRSVPDVQPMTKSSLDVVWAAPLDHLAINSALVLAIAFAMGAGLAVPVPVAATLLAFCGALAVTTYSGYLGTMSSVLLAAGIAVQSGRALAAWVSETRLRTALLVLSTTVGVATCALRANEAWVGRQLAARPAPGVPNVLIVVMDTVRADHLSSYGYARRTPWLDRIAGEGVLFETAIASSSWTLPSHASLLTGLPQWQHGAESVSTVLSPSHQQLQQTFAVRGYRTGAFVANNIFVIPERGFAPGFQVFDAHYLRSLLARTTWGRFGKKTARHYLGFEVDPFRSAHTMIGAFENWRSAEGARPFFALLNLMDAHEPYHPGSRPPDLRRWDLRDRRTAEDNASLLRDYDDSIAVIDRELGRLMQRAIDQGWWDDTIVVLLADHGESISDGSFDHGDRLTLEQIHVPLVIRFPKRIPAKVRVLSPVSVTEVAATVDALAGVDAGHGGETRLTRLFSLQPAELAVPVISELVDPNRSPSRHLRAVILDGFELIEDLDSSSEQLFALSDKAGTNNLAERFEYADVRGRLRAALHRQPPTR